MNRPFSVLADATCDLGEEFQKKYNIRIVPSHLIFPDGSEKTSFFRWDELGRDEFYNMLKQNPEGYSTAPPNVSEFARALEEEIQAGKDVMLLTISGGISGTINFAEQARKQVLEKHPEATVICVDTRRFGPAFGMVVCYAAELRNKGETIEKTEEMVRNYQCRIHQAGWLDDLSFLAKKGRMTNAKAFFGTLAGVKPIGEFDENGMTTVIGKARGAKSAYAVLLQYIRETIENPEEQTIVVAHTNRLAQAEAYCRMLEEAFHPKAVRLADVFPMCGISIGPGLMAAYYEGRPISKGLTEERTILEKCSENKP